MINGEGDVLIHQKHDMVRAGANFKNQDFIRAMRENPGESMLRLYTAEDGIRYFGAFTKLSLANAVVITNIAYDWELVGNRLVTEEMPPVTVKGKKKPVRLFTVIKLKDNEEARIKSKREPETLAELRELYRAAVELDPGSYFWRVSLVNGAGAISGLNLSLPGTISWRYRKILTYRPTYPAPRSAEFTSAGFQTG
jgi:hypothetical protein